ncbi:hypothetical protein Tco_0714527, partial [Tanacetum coccineum]
DIENVYEEEDDLYKDVDVRLLGAEQDKERKVIEDAHVTLTSSQKTKSSKQSSFVSSDFTSKFLILENVSPAVDEVASMMNVKILQEESSTQATSLFTVPEMAIPETATTYTTTVSPTISMITPLLQLTTPSTAPTTVPTTTSTPALPDFSSLFRFDQRVSTLETELALSNESTKNVIVAKSSSQPKSTYEASTSLTEFELKKILLDKIEKSKSYQATPEHKELYDGLTVNIRQSAKTPPSGINQGLMKRKMSKDTEPPKGSKSKESKTSSSKGTKSQRKSSSKSVQAEELVFETANTEIPQDQGEKQPLTFDELMSTPIDFLTNVLHNLKIDNITQEILVRPSFNLLKGTCKSFVELEYHFEECYKAVTDQLDWNNPEGHEYPFHLSKPLSLIKDQGGSSSRKYTTSTTKTKAAKYDNIEGIEDMFMMLWSPVKVAYDKFAMWDLLLLLVQKKLSNLEKDVIFDLNVALRMFTRRIVILKQVEDLQLGVESYQKKLNITKPETFRSDISKLVQFCDGTLSSVRKVLHDITSSLEMDYLPKRRWSKLDRKRSRIMIKAIDQQLFERRLMRNLEKFVGGREYGNDFRLLERTI